MQKEIILSKPTKDSVKFKSNQGGYCIGFVYSNKGNFVLKGTTSEVKKYLRTRTHIKYFANLTIWKDGRSRSIWKFWNDRFYIVEPRIKFNYNKMSFQRKKVDYLGWSKWKVTDFKNNTLSFKRMPKRWIPEFENFK